MADIKDNKRKVGLTVWWSFGSGDGDGYESEMEVNEEQYKLLSKYDGEEIDEIDEPELKDLLNKVYDDEIEALKEESRSGWEPYEEGETFEDYWDNIGVGVRIDHNFEEDLF